MPDRIVRDELLTSEAYWNLPTDSHRMAFTHWVLSADDNANAEAGHGYLCRTILNRRIEREDGDAFLAAFTVDDMLRPYTVDGKRYVHIRKFGQRMRYPKGRHPRPPAQIDTLQNNASETKKPVLGPSAVAPQPVHSQSQVVEVKRREVKRSEVKRSEVKQQNRPEAAREDGPTTPTDAHGRPLGDILQTFKTNHAIPPPAPDEAPQVNGVPNWAKSDRGIIAKAAELDIAAFPGETYQAWAARLLAADRAKAQTAPPAKPKAKRP